LKKIGIMQGRLAPPEAGRFQSFPRTQWREEFARAAEVGLDYIEWIYDGYGADINPLMTDDGIRELQALMQTNGVAIPSLCADFFMERPLVRDAAAREFLRELLPRCKAIGVQRIVLPFVDNSEIKPDEVEAAVAVVREAAGWAGEAGIELHLESSLPPRAFAALLSRLPAAIVKVNYDSGNSSSLGYVPAEEFAAYGDRLGSVHIKDRVLAGGTVPLGCGSADFKSLFSELRRISYAGDFTLQVARGEAGKEVEWTRGNLEWFHRYWAA
jgi:hexulose-6-phosphate isomerase